MPEFTLSLSDHQLLCSATCVDLVLIVVSQLECTAHSHVYVNLFETNLPIDSQAVPFTSGQVTFSILRCTCSDPFDSNVQSAFEVFLNWALLKPFNVHLICSTDIVIHTASLQTKA